MKRYLRLLPVLLIPFSLVGCKGDETSNNSAEAIENAETSFVSGDSVALYHKVTFLNYDNTKLLEVTVKDGGTAVYSGKTPTKEADDEFTYEFKGWDKELTNVTSDFSTKAVYNPVAKENWGSIEWF